MLGPFRFVPLATKWSVLLDNPRDSAGLVLGIDLIRDTMSGITLLGEPTCRVLAVQRFWPSFLLEPAPVPQTSTFPLRLWHREPR